MHVPVQLPPLGPVKPGMHRQAEGSVDAVAVVLEFCGQLLHAFAPRLFLKVPAGHAEGMARTEASEGRGGAI